MSSRISLQPLKTPRQARSRATVTAIVQATARVLARDGYAKTSTNRIARAAGVSVGSLYQYFPGKDALVLAVARGHAEEMLKLLSQAALETADAPIATRIRALVHGMIAAHQGDPALHKALVEQVLHLGLDHMADVQKQARALVRGWLAEHRDELLIDDLDTAAYLLVTTVEAVIHAALFDAPERLTEPAFEAELVSMIRRYLLGGEERT